MPGSADVAGVVEVADVAGVVALASVAGVAGARFDPAALALRGLAVPPFNMAETLAIAARERPDAVWIKGREAVLSYAEAHSLAGRMAASLIAASLAPGDRVAVLIPNHPAFVVAIWGGWLAGGVCSAMHPAYAEPTLAAQLDDLDPQWLVTIDDPELLARAERLTAGRAIHLLALPAAGAMEAAPWLAREPAPPRLTDVDALALLQYTGGTTGGVKAAMLSHRNLSLNIG